MKHILIISSLLISSLTLSAQDNDGWLVKFDEAAEISMKTGKLNTS